MLIVWTIAIYSMAQVKGAVGAGQGAGDQNVTSVGYHTASATLQGSICYGYIVTTNMF